MTTAEAARIAAAVGPLLPPALVPVFDAQFTRSNGLFDEYVLRLTLDVVERAKLDVALGGWGTVAEIVARAGLAPGPSLVPVDWMLRHLAARGVLARDDGRFRAERPLPRLDAAAVLAEQLAHDRACAPSYEVAAAAAQDYPAFLRGERPGEEILLAPARLPLWMRYFSNDNPLYAVNNRVGAAALAAWLPPGGGTIVELGGGLGSGASAVLDALAAAGRLGDVRAYRFTELVPAFLRRAQRSLETGYAGATSLSFATLDMNRGFEAQGLAPASAAVVYAVNTLHVAADLALTLGEVRATIEPGGRVILGECVRPWPGQTVYPEFVFNLMATFRAPRLEPRYRPNGGFLTPEQWTAALLAAGFEDVRVLPDVARLREVFPGFTVAAIGARRPA